MALFLNVVENFALLGLSIYTSVDNYGKLIYNTRLDCRDLTIIAFLEIHKNCFCTFIVVSETYMMLTYDLQKNSKREGKLSPSEITSLNLKRNLFIINITSILLATYFFIRHNDRCEGGSKSTFLTFKHNLYSTLLFSSLHFLRPLRVHRRAYKHGISYDSSNRIPQPAFIL